LSLEILNTKISFFIKIYFAQQAHYRGEQYTQVRKSKSDYN
jgi:hypothetical protein